MEFRFELFDCADLSGISDIQSLQKGWSYHIRCVAPSNFK